jgi:hypothetical protein
MVMQHVLGHAAWTWTCSIGMSLDMQHVNVLAACPSTWCVSMLHVHGHAEWTWTCCMSMFMSKLHVHVQVKAACPCPSPCWMFMSMRRVPVHAACPCSCCMPMSILPVHVHTACLCQCCKFKSMQHRDGHEAWTATCSIDMGMQHVLGHAAWTCTCQHGHLFYGRLMKGPKVLCYPNLKYSTYVLKLFISFRHSISAKWRQNETKYESGKRKWKTPFRGNPTAENQNKDESKALTPVQELININISTKGINRR